MGFSNKNMKQPVSDKPHIQLIMGLWRVSPLGKTRKYSLYQRWQSAHTFTRIYNDTRVREVLKKNEIERVNERLRSFQPTDER